MQERVERMEALLQQWEALLARLSTEAEAAGTSATPIALKVLSELKARHDEARLKFGELRMDSRDRLESAWNAVEAEWASLDAVFASLAAMPA
jgi:hypothetical protein